MLDILHSIGLIVIRQILICNKDMLFAILEGLMDGIIFVQMKDIINIIRGGPLINTEFLKSVQGAVFAEKPNSVHCDICMCILKALKTPDILYIRELSMHIHTYIHIHICTQPAASVFADVYVGVKTHLRNIHTFPFTSAQNTCKVHVTLTAKKCTYIYTYTHMHTHTYAHEHTRACMTLSTR